MDLESGTPWPRRRLRRLGEALAEGEVVPDGCPSYDDVLLWHHDLAAEVASVIGAKHPWASFPTTEPLRPSARSKTHDTLVQKLNREEHLTLDQVQDLAGVRIDVDCSLDEQLALAVEIAAHFGADRAKIKDIRDNPHSGYRGVHVWLKLPAGRVEIQIRTLMQSAWANTYERLGDVAGRGIRYGEDSDVERVRNLVDYMQSTSQTIAEAESVDQQVRDVRDALSKIDQGQHDELPEILRNLGELEVRVEGLKATYIERLGTLKNQLDEMGG